MTGYAVEVKLIQRKCHCKKHANGVCSTPQTVKDTELSHVYYGGFNVGVRTPKEAHEKFHSLFEKVLA